MTVDPRKERVDATTPQGVPNLHWLLEQYQRGLMSEQEFVKLMQERGQRLSETLLDSELRHRPPNIRTGF